MQIAPGSPPSLLVACLCAAWCGSCRDYRALFDGVAAGFPGATFRWVDIEDEADRVDPVEVENFPTLLIATDGVARFFGPLTPHRETLVRLVRAHAEVPGPAVPAADVQALVARLAS